MVLNGERVVALFFCTVDFPRNQQKCILRLLVCQRLTAARELHATPHFSLKRASCIILMDFLFVFKHDGCLDAYLFAIHKHLELLV